MLAKIRGLLESTLMRAFTAVTIGGVAIVLATRDIDFNQVGEAMDSVNLMLVGVALLTVILNLFAKIIRWQVLLSASGEHVILRRLALVYMGGQMLNFVVPMRAGDLGRAYVVGESGTGRAYALGTLVLEKLFDLVAYTLMFSIMLMVLPLPDWITDTGFSPLPIGILIITVVVFSFLFSKQIEKKLNLMLAENKEMKFKKVIAWLAAGLESAEILRNPKHLLRIVLLTILIWGLALANNYFIMKAFHLDHAWAASLLLLIVLQAGISFIYVPGTIGVFEYLCIESLRVFGVSKVIGLSFGVILHGTVLLPILIGGLVALVFWRPGMKYREGEDQGEKTSIESNGDKIK